MITPLRKHRGQNGAVAAVFVLIAASVIIWTTQPGTKPAPVEPAPPRVISAPASATVQPVTVTKPAPRTGKITATGVTSYDELATAHIFAPVRGWVTKVAVPVGKRVRAGETLATLQSVDVYLGELDLVTQIQQFTTQARLSDARRRLLRWGMRKQSIDRVEQTGIATGTLPLIALRDGTVVAHEVVPGQYVERMEAFTITDPSRSWVFVDVEEAMDVRVGTPAKLLVAGTAKPITAKVAHIYRPFDGMRKLRFDLVSRTRIEPGLAVEVQITLD
jgi:multidrug resistance efflux pump